MAINGTRNVLNACLKHNISKVVVTSSAAAIINNKNKNQITYTEKDWSDPNIGGVYEKSKTRAEKEAWRIALQSKGKINLTVINPNLIVGKFLMDNKPTSASLLITLFKVPVLLNNCSGWVSVDTVAEAHVLALENPTKSRNQRYILCENSYWTYDIVDMLREEFSKFGYKFPTFMPPKILIQIVGCFSFSNTVSFVAKNWGKRKICDNSKVKNELGLKFRFHKDYILEAYYSLIEKGFIENKLKKNDQLM